MDAVRFDTARPPAELSGLVHELWMLRDDGSFRVGLPKPHVELVVSLRGVHWWRADRSSPEHRYDTGWLTPVQDGPRYARADGARHLIGARLEPWAARAWFGELPPGDGTPPPRLASLLGDEARRLACDLREAADDARCFERFGRRLARLARARATPRASYDVPEEYRVRHLAAAVATTPRGLRRTFAAEVGMGPKRWLLLHRLDGVLRDDRLADPEFPLAELALEHGFSDQAHLSREMLRYTGATPRTFRRRETSFPPHMRAASRVDT